MNILVTNFQDSYEDVMIFTDYLTPQEVKQRLDDKGETYTDICAVEDEDLQYYFYEPCYMYRNENSTK